MKTTIIDGTFTRTDEGVTFKPKKLNRYMITFENWASPIFINAYKVENAINRAYELFPVCDCGCGEHTEVKLIEKLR